MGFTTSADDRSGRSGGIEAGGIEAADTKVIAAAEAGGTEAAEAKVTAAAEAGEIAAAEAGAIAAAEQIEVQVIQLPGYCLKCESGHTCVFNTMPVRRWLEGLRDLTQEAMFSFVSAPSFCEFLLNVSMPLVRSKL